jgi:hypothetical protein
MGFVDLFRPKHRHSDVRVRSEAVRALANDEIEVLLQIAKTDRDPAVRKIAIEKIGDADVLADLTTTEKDDALIDLAGARAASLWTSVACGGDVEAAGKALTGLVRLEQQRAVAEVAARAELPSLRKRAMTELRDPRALAELAKTASQPETRMEAVARIDDDEVLRALATDAMIKEVGLAAVDRLDDPELLEAVAQKAKNKAVRQRARKVVTEMEEAERAARPKVSDELKRRRAERAQLLRRLDAVVESFDFVKATAEVKAVEAAWAAIAERDADEQDVAAADKFAAQTKKFWQRRDVHDQAAGARVSAPMPVVSPAIDEPAAVEAAPAESIDRESDERRAEREARRAEDEARRKADAEARAARAKEDAERGKELAASLDALIGEMESLLESKDGRAIDRLLGQAQRSFDQLGKVASGERAALAERYDRVRAALVIRVKDLREADDWQRFANVPKAESLIREAKALLEAEAGPDLGGKLKDLQSRWKSVGAIPHKKSKELWDTFKATCDQVYAKVVERRAVDQEKFAESAKVKERLIAEAEALATSTDWAGTADRLKALQAEWKSSGHLPRKQGDELWKRFRAACDRFFEARKPHLDAQLAEQVGNLEAKAALCARIEAIVEAAPGERGWGAAIGDVKAAQRDWKEIGFVPRADADAIYKRFRTACDALFAKRDAARDAEADGRRAELDAIRAEIDAITGSSGDDVVARAIAVRGRLKGLAGDDDRRGLSVEMTGLVDRMVRHVVATSPEAARGTELDPTVVVNRRKKLVERAEALLPQDAPAVSTDESPGAIAERLKSAMRANAFGGLRFGGRDPIEVIDELRGEWAAAGPAIGDEADALQARFEDVAGRVLGAERGERSEPSEVRERSERGRERRRRRTERGERSGAVSTERTSDPSRDPSLDRSADPSRDPSLDRSAAEAEDASLTAPATSAVPAHVPTAGPNADTSKVVAAAIPTASPDEQTSPVDLPDPISATPKVRDEAPAPVPSAATVPVTGGAAMPAVEAAATDEAVSVAEAAPRARRLTSLTEPPPMDDLDSAWDLDDAPAPTEPPPSPPTAGELAGDGAVDNDHLDVD